MEVTPGYKQTEVGVIPENWESTNVSGIASPVRNAIVGGPFGSDLVSDDYVDDGVPVIRGQNLGSQWVSGNFAFVSHAKANSLESNLARPGDLVFTQRGTLGQVSLVPDKPFDRYLVSQSQMKLTLNRKIADPLFFYYVFSSSEQQELIRQNTIQTGVPHINLGILRTIPVQCPTLPEQEAIAEVLSKADALIDCLERLIAKKRLLKKGVMQQLLIGEKRLPGFAGKWGVTRFGDVVTQRNERIDPRKNGTQEFCIELEHIGSATGSLLGSASVGEHSSLKSVFRAGDVLFGKLRAYLRKYWWADRPGVCSTEIWVLLSRENLIHAGFLFQVVQTDRFIEAASSSYGTHMPRSDWNVVKNFEMPLPATLAEQEAIAEVLSAMDAEIALLEAQLAKYRQLKQGLMQKLLTGRIRLI
jgi:type I restriction enzyme, S subunit